MVAKVAVGIGSSVIALALLIIFVVIPRMSTPPAHGANIGAGLLSLFSLVLLGGGALVAAAGLAFWIRNRLRRGPGSGGAR